ncbi:MAG: chondroitinase-B domain-containing protein [Minicystis sp.]
MATRSLHLRAFASAAALSLCARAAHAGDALVIPGPPTLDPPTITALGVQLLVSGDDNHDAKVTVRYRKAGATAWRTGLPFHRVRPDVVNGFSVPDQLAGSLFDLSPATTYDIELHVVDADGGVDQTLTLQGSTRPVPPLDPKSPSMKPVTDAASLSAALASAKAGDVILLKKGTYAGTFSIDASGTADNPIVIRGESEEEVILDGGGDSGNVLEVYGSFVHVERLTIQNANRALRFQGAGAVGNVVRRIHTRDTTLGIGSKQGQKDFYICDNILEGRLVWPAVYADDGGQHANDDGIHVEGTGHVICHNQLRGWGDAMKTEEDGARGLDFYGNEVLSAYDNGLELDGSAGNTRALRNRFTNTYATISFQPIYGGPVYAIRNVIVNVANEQLKFHSLGGTQETSGIYVLHNTFVSPKHALSLSDSTTSHHFVIENNLFIGPSAPDQGRTVDWTGTIDDGLFDYNGYYPEGIFAFDFAATGYQKYASFAALQAAGVETHGLVVGGSEFTSGLTAPADYTVTLPAADVTLKPASAAVDKGVLLPGVNDDFQGKAPDLGAIEVGCAAPIYGVRPEGMDETNMALGCAGSGGTGGTGTGGASAGSGGGGVGGNEGGAGGNTGGAGGDGGEKGGCGCRTAGEGSGDSALGSMMAGAVVIALRRRRARHGKKTVTT